MEACGKNEWDGFQPVHNCQRLWLQLHAIHSKIVRKISIQIKIISIIPIKKKQIQLETFFKLFWSVHLPSYYTVTLFFISKFFVSCFKAIGVHWNENVRARTLKQPRYIVQFVVIHYKCVNKMDQVFPAYCLKNKRG